MMTSVLPQVNSTRLSKDNCSLLAASYYYFDLRSMQVLYSPRSPLDDVFWLRLEAILLWFLFKQLK